MPVTPRISPEVNQVGVITMPSEVVPGMLAMARPAAFLGPLLAALLLSFLVMSPKPGTGFLVKEEALLHGQSIEGIARYGFEAGGHANFTLSVTTVDRLRNATIVPGSSGGLYIVMCTNEELTALYESRENLCSPISEAINHCSWVKQLSPDRTVAHFDEYVKSAVDLSFLYLNCFNTGIIAKVDTKFINPHNEHLSRGDIPLKYLSPSYLAIWIIMELFWWSSILKHRQSNTQLQVVLSIVPSTAVLKLMLWSTYWNSISVTGYAPMAVYIPSSCAYGLFRGALFVCLLIIARGWMITRSSLHSSDWQAILVMSGAYALSYMAWRIFTTFFFLFVMVVIYVLMLRFIFGAITDNMFLLLYRVQIFRRRNLDYQRSPQWAQLMLYRNLRSSLIIFVCLDILFRVWGMVALQDAAWIEFVLEESCSVAVAAGIGYIFRSKENSPFYGCIDPQLDRLAQYPGEVYAVLALDEFGQTATPNFAEQIPLLEASSRENYSATAMNEDRPSVVLVQNPPSYDEMGNEILNVSVGKPLDPRSEAIV